jgi:hypothetical protein
MTEGGKGCSVQARVARPNLFDRGRPSHCGRPQQGDRRGQTSPTDPICTDHPLCANASNFSIQPLKCGHCARITFRPIFWLMRTPSKTLA